jgi:transcriptional regulator with XRE-family HTH domain
MQTIGERLEEARKKKGISIREAAEATKIRGDYLSKFENNQFDINLTELYVRGFLRNYAQFLRLPADRILNDYAALGRAEARPRQPSREIYGRMDVSIVSADERNDSKPAPAEEAPPPPQPARRSSTGAGRRVGAAPGPGIDPALVFKYGKWAAIALAGVLIIWALVSVVNTASEDRISKSPTNSASSPVQASEPSITLVALDTVTVSVFLAGPDGRDGAVLLPETTLPRGQSRVVPKPGPIYVRYSDSKNLAVEINGVRHNMPPGKGPDRAQIR